MYPTWATLKVPNSGKPEFGWGRVDARSQVYAGCVNLPALAAGWGIMANEMTINEVLRTRPHPVSLRSTTLPLRGRDCSLLTKLSSSCTRDKV